MNLIYKTSNSLLIQLYLKKCCRALPKTRNVKCIGIFSLRQVNNFMTINILPNKCDSVGLINQSLKLKKYFGYCKLQVRFKRFKNNVYK